MRRPFLLPKGRSLNIGGVFCCVCTSAACAPGGIIGWGKLQSYDLSGQCADVWIGDGERETGCSDARVPTHSGFQNSDYVTSEFSVIDVMYAPK